MEYEEIVKKIVDTKRPDWEMCHEKLLDNYREYYSDDISFYKKPTPESILLYNYNFILKSKSILENIKNLFGSDAELSSTLENNHIIASIHTNSFLDKKDKHIFQIRSHEVFLPSWYYYEFVSSSGKFHWTGGNMIFMRKINNSRWYRYDWLLDIDLRDPDRDLNNYKIYDKKKYYRILTNSELTETLKVVKPYLDQTVLYRLLMDRDMILLERYNAYDPYSDLYVAIPDSQVQWHNYELMWVFNFYKRYK